MNHGSFGACPIPVLEECQRWQRELERHPVKYLGREFNALLGESRRVLAEYLNCPPEDVVYFTNPTTAINMVARSLNLQSGDEILATNHEYGATNRTWRFVAEKMGARYINQPIQVPFGDKAEVVEQFWRIDGAHAPGHIPVDLVDLGADIYTGACHKWLCAPKGAAFLYVAKHLQAAMNPLVVSWGYEAEIPGESQYLDYHEWQGTRDISAFLTVPVAINLVTRPAWQQSQVECRRMASRWWRTLQSVHGLLPLSSTDSWFGQMFALQIPGTD
ncbi:MAG: aminotransferase class V-fold PLP-dependent enzyme, partial [Chloroflexi bacterium]|nr:aminotransferase class V-fold PLP-dependent enzyme [Chloroflexota bacterium]